MEAQIAQLQEQIEVLISNVEKTIAASSGEKARHVSVSLKESGLGAAISTSAGECAVSAFIREDSIENILSLLEDADLLKGLSVEKEKIRKAPRNVLFWAMESA